EEPPERMLRPLRKRLLLGLALGLPLFVLASIDRVMTSQPVAAAIGPLTNLLIQALLCAGVVLVSGWPFLVRGWLSIRNLQLNSDTLVVLGVGAAFIYSLAALVYHISEVRPLARQQDPRLARLGAKVEGELEVLAPYQQGTVEPFFESAAAIVLLMLFGRVFELNARVRTAEAVRKLTRLAPDTARIVLPDGREETRSVSELHTGAIVKIPAAARVPVDGIIREGTSTFDESMLTGEPTLIEKGPGAEVMAGTLNGLRDVTVETARVTRDTLVYQVAAMVERAQQSRIPLQRTVDRIIGRLVPFVVLAAILTFTAWGIFAPPATAISYGTLCAVGVLIVSCPCALGLATPLAIVAGMRRANRTGILFRDAAALERLAHVDAVLFDKTGTLTEGRPRLVAVTPSVGETAEEMLALAAAVERGSEHAIGRAIVWEAVKRGIPITLAESVETIPGKGIRGLVNGERVVVGTLGFLQESGAYKDLAISEAINHQMSGRGVTFVSRGDRCIGMVATEDPLRPTSLDAVTRLRDNNVRVVLVTGDNSATAASVARSLALLEVVADTVPAEKYAVVRRIQNEGRVVAFCGDGTNDAPALAAADVGIALGSGTDIAMSAASVALVKPDLRTIAVAEGLSRATVRTIRQNLWLAFTFNLLAIPIAAGILVPLGGGLMSPVWAAAAMGLSSLLVVVNSLRLLRYRVR
ncbi:MAG TPA: heavy metal translocating P-type ATPase, partial [Gemmata sp.]|nr:heavy metal translocating P-type ATPase [Gemmata sp.]